MDARIYEIFRRRWNELCERVDSGKWWSDLWDIAKADKSEWIRLFELNVNLRTEIRRLQRKYHLPIPTNSELRDYRKFYDFNLELITLLQEHDIPEKWWSWIGMIAIRGTRILPSFSLGYPQLSADIDNNGELEPIITPEVPTANPFIAEYILHLNILRDPPPQPMKKGRRTDWQPVFEWHLRHPQIKLEELADMLNYNYSYLRRRISDLKD